MSMGVTPILAEDKILFSVILMVYIGRRCGQ